MADDAGTGDDEEEWRFSVDEVGDDTGDTAARDEESDESESWGVTVGDDDDGPTVTMGGPERAAEEIENEVADESGNVAGSVAVDVPVESDTPDLESAVFVGAGALLILLVFASIPTTLTPTTVGAITLAVAAVTGILYAIFVRF
ncbi:hypothetical protein BRC79_03185 [Halobacteriales archaeon QH_8_67_27]|nr:MAG: hypothetical protein BRC79_03185 [Halobacteriales archaeon QH_8_67_27]